MEHHTANWPKSAILMIAALAFLAGCGGGDKKKKSEPTCLDSVEIFLGCVLFSESGKESGLSSTPSGATNDEYEPNNVLANANLLSLPAMSTDAAEPVTIGGSITSLVDATDFFIFTPPASGAYRLFVCAASCDTAAIDDAVYLMVYDQSQTTVAATPVGISAEQLVDVELTAGLAYYIEINGYNVGDVRYDYELAFSRL
jgi:hypothetical protein